MGSFLEVEGGEAGRLKGGGGEEGRSERGRGRMGEKERAGQEKGRSVSSEVEDKRKEEGGSQTCAPGGIAAGGRSCIETLTGSRRPAFDRLLSLREGA